MTGAAVVGGVVTAGLDGTATGAAGVAATGALGVAVADGATAPAPDETRPAGLAVELAAELAAAVDGVCGGAPATTA